MTMPDLSRLITPRSVAIVGASPTPGALGNSVLKNLDRHGFRGDIHLINPKRAVIDERACLPSIADLPHGVDVAVLAIPGGAVQTAIEALAARGVGAAIIFSAGFAEGGDEGLAAQAEVARIAREHGMVIEGPNCLGLVNYAAGVPLTFVEVPVLDLAGKPAVGIVSQSGAMAVVLGTTLMGKGLGITLSVSTGNEAASGVEDYVEHLLDDLETPAIGMIVEQFRQPRRFIELAERARGAGKTIVLLHPGTSSAARASAATSPGESGPRPSDMRSSRTCRPSATRAPPPRYSVVVRHHDATDGGAAGAGAGAERDRTKSATTARCAGAKRP